MFKSILFAGCCMLLAACAGGSSVTVHKAEAGQVKLSYLDGVADRSSILYVGAANCPSRKATITSMGEPDTTTGRMGDWKLATVKCD